MKDFSLNNFQKESLEYFDRKIRSWEKNPAIKKGTSKIREIYNIAKMLEDLSEEGKRVIVDIGMLKSFDSLDKAYAANGKIIIPWNKAPHLEIKPLGLISFYSIQPHYNYLALIAESGKFLSGHELDKKYLENVILMHPKGSVYAHENNLRERLMSRLTYF